MCVTSWACIQIYIWKAIKLRYSIFLLLGMSQHLKEYFWMHHFNDYSIVTCQYSACTQQTVCWHVRSWACDIKSIFFRYSLIKSAETLQARCTINNPAKNKHLSMVHVSQSYDSSIGNNYQTCKVLKPSVIRKYMYNKITFSVLTWDRKSVV